MVVTLGQFKWSKGGARGQPVSYFGCNGTAANVFSCRMKCFWFTKAAILYASIRISCAVDFVFSYGYFFLLVSLYPCVKLKILACCR